MSDPYQTFAIREAVLLTSMLGIAWLLVIASQARFLPRATQWFRESPILRGLLVALLLAIGPVTTRSKNGQLSLPRPPMTLTVQSSAAAPSFVVYEARTNGVAMVAPTTNAVVSQSCLLHGASEQGEWIESDAPFFFHWKFPRQHKHPTRVFAEEAVASGEGCRAINQASRMRRAERPSLHA